MICRQLVGSNIYSFCCLGREETTVIGVEVVDDRIAGLFESMVGCCIYRVCTFLVLVIFESLQYLLGPYYVYHLTLLAALTTLCCDNS